MDNGRKGLRSSQITPTKTLPREGGASSNGVVKDDTPPEIPVNLTPHAIHALKCGGEVGELTGVVYPAATQGPVRLRSRPQTLSDVRPDDVYVYSMPEFERELENFPYTPEDKSHPDIIVAGLVAPYVPQWFRGQVLVPDTGPDSVLRDNEGRIVAVRRLYQVHAECRLMPEVFSQKKE